MSENTQQKQTESVSLPVPPMIKNTPLVSKIQFEEPTTNSIQHSESGTTEVTEETEFKWKFAEEIHQYLRDQIRQADQKAAFFFAGSTALIAFLYKAKLVYRWVKFPTQWLFLDMISFLATFGLAISAFACLFVVFPRLKGSKRGIVFFNAISEFESQRDYSDNVLQQNINNLIKAKLCHSHDLALVCTQKYNTLAIVFLSGALGVFATVLLLMLAT